MNFSADEKVGRESSSITKRAMVTIMAPAIHATQAVKGKGTA